MRSALYVEGVLKARTILSDSRYEFSGMQENVLCLRPRDHTGELRVPVNLAPRVQHVTFPPAQLLTTRRGTSRHSQQETP